MAKSSKLLWPSTISFSSGGHREFLASDLKEYAQSIKQASSRNLHPMATVFKEGLVIFGIHHSKPTRDTQKVVLQQLINCVTIQYMLKWMDSFNVNAVEYIYIYILLFIYIYIYVLHVIQKTFNIRLRCVHIITVVKKKHVTNR